jgi:hypothetical protein
LFTSVTAIAIFVISGTAGGYFNRFGEWLFERYEGRLAMAFDHVDAFFIKLESKAYTDSK